MNKYRNGIFVMQQCLLTEQQSRKSRRINDNNSAGNALRTLPSRMKTEKQEFYVTTTWNGIVLKLDTTV